MALQDISMYPMILPRFPQHVQDTAMWLRNLIWERYPESNELIYLKDKYFAVGWGFSDKQTDIFVTVAAYSQHVNLGFNFGPHIADSKAYLQGSGNMYRYFRMGAIADFPMAEMLQFMDEGWVIANAKFKPPAHPIKGQTILKQDTRKS